MKYYYIVRHGEKQKIQGDPPLSLKGVKQAKHTAKYLSQFPVELIFSSPLRRARQTAEEIGKIFKIPVSVSPLLRERVNWGDDPNQSMEDFLSMWQKASTDRNWQPPVGDSSIQAGKRIMSLVETLFSHPADHIVIVSHGGIITDFLRNLFDESHLSNHIPNFSSTLDENIKDCSVTILKWSMKHDKFKLIKLASTRSGLLTNITVNE